MFNHFTIHQQLYNAYVYGHSFADAAGKHKNVTYLLYCIFLFTSNICDPENMWEMCFVFSKIFNYLNDK